MKTNHILTLSHFSVFVFWKWFCLWWRTRSEKGVLGKREVEKGDPFQERKTIRTGHFLVSKQKKKEKHYKNGLENWLVT